MEREHRVTLAILGGGPAGYYAALRARHRGVSTVVVEDGNWGGTCLNQGCIPTKALLRTGELIGQEKLWQELGIKTGPMSVDWQAAQNRKSRVVKSLRTGLEQLLQHENIRLISGRGKITGLRSLEVDTEDGPVRVEYEKLIVATGSVPGQLTIPGSVSGERIFTSQSMLDLSWVPKSLVVIGGGAIGLEFAQLYRGLGSKVQVLELGERLLPEEDRELGEELYKAMKRQGIQFRFSARVMEIKEEDDGVRVFYEIGGEAGEGSGDGVLLALGRKVRLPAGLVELGVELEPSGAIRVNEWMETSLPGIYAAGDVTGGRMLAHKAYGEGRVALDNALGYEGIINQQAVPSCLYTHPEIATVGWGEDRARREGKSVVTGRFSFRHNGRALCLGERDGFVKVVAEKESGIILGAQIIGPQASELISELTLAVAEKIPARVLADLIHPHPALGEAIMEACAEAAGFPVHKS